MATPRELKKVRRAAFHKMNVQESWDGIFPVPLYDHREAFEGERD